MNMSNEQEFQRFIKLVIIVYLLFNGLVGRTFTAALLITDDLLKEFVLYARPLLSRGSAPLLHSPSDGTEVAYSFLKMTTRKTCRKNVASILSMFIYTCR